MVPFSITKKKAIVANGAELWGHFLSDSIFGRARSRVVDTIFSNGLEIEGAHPDFAEHYRRIYELFLLDAFDQMVVYGFVLVRKIRRKISGRWYRIPYLVSPLTVNVCVETDDDTGDDWFVQKSQGTMAGLERDPSIFIWLVPGEHPDPITGEFRSRVQRTMGISRWISQMYWFALQAEFVNSFPYLTLQRNKDATDLKNINNIPTIPPSTIPNIGALPARQLAPEATKNEGFKTAFSAADVGPFRARTTPSGIGGYRTLIPSFGQIYTVPDELQMAPHAPRAYPRADLIDMEREREEAIASIMGVPANLIMGGRRRGINTTASAEENDLVVFRDTCHRIREWMLSLLWFVHEEVLFQDPRNKDRTDGLKFSIPFSPITATADELERMAASGVISEETFRAAWLLRVGLNPETEPRADIPPKPFMIRELEEKTKQKQLGGPPK